MARLGKVLLGLELITPDQLKQGVAAQILYGGRLGTNLVELGFLDVDTLANALARRMNLPAALKGHFDLCDAAIQERLPARLAERWKTVPIGRLAHDPSRIAIAVMDPLPADGLATIASCLEVDPGQLVMALTPELRLLYHLERVYGVQRGIRFLRIRNPEPATVPEPPTEDTSDVEIEIIRDVPGDGEGDGGEEAGERRLTTAERAAYELAEQAVREDVEGAHGAGAGAGDGAGDAGGRAGRALGSDPALDARLGPPPALDYGVAPPLDDEIGRGQRRFVPSLGDGAVTLARIAVRHVASEPFLFLGDVDERPRPTSAPELLRAVRRAASRDQVAELVVGGLADLGCLDTVAILVVRPPIALGWRGFCPAGEGAIESLAVPLDQPGCLATIHAAAIGSSGAIDGDHATVIDQRMWEVFGTPAPAEVMVSPILLGSQVVCLLYGQTQADLGAARELGPALAQAAGIAFGRLLRAAQR
ncbi:MAG TPA: hypothetical protein VHE35_37480 [Kofleriaceae bacterium]|nr:hypothetical protein [Kofleriaceae bacterium]